MRCMMVTHDILRAAPLTELTPGRKLLRFLGLAVLAMIMYGGSILHAQGAPEAALTAHERAAVLEMVLQATPAATALRGSRHRVFAVDATVVKVSGGVQRQAHTLVYDYTHNRTYRIVTDITAGVPGTLLDITLMSTQLPPHAEEYAEAKALVASLGQVQRLLEDPYVVLQEGFPVDGGPAPCDVHRCVQIHVNEIIPGVRAHFLLFVTVDLSTLQIVAVREARDPTSLAQ
jgi:hypothetical protein